MKLSALVRCVYVFVFLFLVGAGSAFAQTGTDPTAIISSASGQYGAAVAIFISAAAIGAAILYIRKGLRGRM